MDTLQIRSLLEQTKVALDDFESTKAETSRIQAHEQTLKLARALERPRDAILKLAYTVRMTRSYHDYHHLLSAYHIIPYIND